MGRPYQLYINGPGGDITNKVQVYARTSPKMWMATVHADSIKEAYRYLARQIGAVDGKDGIVTIDHSDGPTKGWPWRLPVDKYGPSTW